MACYHNGEGGVGLGLGRGGIYMIDNIDSITHYMTHITHNMTHISYNIANKKHTIRLD